jgi:ketosteroid isomerase-like protein
VSTADAARSMQAMLDEWQCRKAVETYWYAEANQDIDLLASVFTEDGVWGPAAGQAEIRKLAQHFIDTSDIASQHVVPHEVRLDVDGDTARGGIKGVAFIRERTGGSDNTENTDDTVVVVGIAYAMEYRRVAGEWKIASMTAPKLGKAEPLDTEWHFAVPNSEVTYDVSGGDSLG